MSVKEEIHLINLALHREVSCSSESEGAAGSQAVDGLTTTCWQPLMSDKKANNRVWMKVDLGEDYSVNQAVLKLTSGFISRYSIRCSLDNLTWQTAFQRDTARGGISTSDRALFPRVEARYVMLEVELFDPERDFQLVEFGIFDDVSYPSGPILDRVFVRDANRTVYEQDDTFTMHVSSQADLVIQGILTDSSQADLAEAEVVVQSTKHGIVTAAVDTGEALILRTHASGVAQIQINVTLNGVTQENSLFVDVYDPTEGLADIQLVHDSLVSEIGQPALIAVDDFYPALKVIPGQTMAVKADLLNMSTGELLWSHPVRDTEAGVAATFTFPGQATIPGLYQISVEFTLAGDRMSSYYEACYFTVPSPLVSLEGKSQIVHKGADGQLLYVPDYKGNRILDFSHSGYGGGGVRIPDVQPAQIIAPIEGDNTQHIQDAIDRVAVLPLSDEGFRGAVLLKKGIYPINGSILIQASGIVLQGEGEEEGGTLLYATGTKQRNLIEISGSAGPRLITDTETAIVDLYVPSGAQMLRVRDTACFQVGDTIKVIRYGNERWIHAIGMDTIRLRPVAGGTVQWSPFQLEFDREITSIDGNCVTLDAPIACAIEQRWGGGAIIKYEDMDRIKHVGVEHLRIDVAFDPSITDTRIDGNEGTDIYLADEQHAINGIHMDHVKNGWVRNIVGAHLQHALVQVGRSSKWITIQDCEVYDFVSVITGGRRYSFHLTGELTLVQRTYSETARHAYAVDARVAGPNVFLDCTSTMDYNTSEPHHRWSVGCLYDNVNGRIHIQDRGWLGSGHGWSGANYVAWNTSNELLSQQPPTAQNYAIGHVGIQGKPLLPSAYDSRERKMAFWESFGQHVTPRSLYVQQLQDRLGDDAVLNLAQHQ